MQCSLLKMKKTFLKNWHNKTSKGETLLEVIIALLVVTMGCATATTLIILAINANVFNRDSLVAVNLAQEGIEYMRNLRDSNWITYSADKSHCWNMKPDSTVCITPFDNLLKEANGNGANDSGYALGTGIGTPIVKKLNLSDGVSTGSEDKYRIQYYDMDAATNSDLLGSLVDDKDILASDISGGTVVTPTKYYRSIEVSYATIGPAPTWTITPTSDEKAASLMTVSSVVQWMDGPTTHEVRLSSALSNYK